MAILHQIDSLDKVAFESVCWQVPKSRHCAPTGFPLACLNIRISFHPMNEGDACRAKVEECGMRPVVLPNSNRRLPWEHDICDNDDRITVELR